MDTVVTYEHSVTELGHIQTRRITRIMDGGVELTKLYHRHVFCPGDDLSEADDRTKVLADTLWNAEFVAEYAEAVEDGIITEEERTGLWESIKNWFK